MLCCGYKISFLSLSVHKQNDASTLWTINICKCKQQIIIIIKKIKKKYHWYKLHASINFLLWPKLKSNEKYYYFLYMISFFFQYLQPNYTVYAILVLHAVCDVMGFVHSVYDDDDVITIACMMDVLLCYPSIRNIIVYKSTTATIGETNTLHERNWWNCMYKTHITRKSWDTWKKVYMHI